MLVPPCPSGLLLQANLVMNLCVPDTLRASILSDSLMGQSMSITPIRRRKLYEEVAARIEEMIWILKVILDFAKESKVYRVEQRRFTKCVVSENKRKVAFRFSRKRERMFAAKLTKVFQCELTEYH